MPHMKILITGSSGHLGEALMRTLSDGPHEAVGVDILRSPFTNIVGSIADRAVVDACMKGVDAVLHAATLHKPHVATHRRQDFVDTNITGTLNLLEAAVANRVRSFVFTSTTSTFGDALTPPRGRTGHLDHRRRGADPEEHLRHHQGCRRRPVPVVSSEPATALPRAANFAVLSRRR